MSKVIPLVFNETELVKSIDQLPRLARVVFAAACAERMMPAYERFSAQTHRGDPQNLKQILARLWDDLAGNRMSATEVDANINACMQLIPQDDGPWVLEQAAAEDGAAASTYALRCRRSGLAQEAAWAARCAYDALDEYVINRDNIDINATGAEAQVRSDPLVQAELTRQRRDLDELLRGAITQDQLRERSNTEAADFLV
jgi:uncharacterized protein YjaG (DUF416 family)